MVKPSLNYVRVAQEVIHTNSLNTAVASLSGQTSLPKVMNAWNGLPADRIDFSSYPKFQSSLQHCGLTAS